MSKGWISKTREACQGNNNGYLYALISIGKNNGNVFDYSDDKNYHLIMTLTILELLTTLYQG